MSTSIVITIPANRRKIAATAQRRIKAIARSYLFIDTLKVRGSDAADFHDRHVSRLREALTRAWHDGFNEALHFSEDEGGVA